MIARARHRLDGCEYSAHQHEHHTEEPDDEHGLAGIVAVVGDQQTERSHDYDVGECEDHDVQQASPAAIAEHGIRQAKTGEDHEERHGHIRDHLAEDEGGLAHRGHVDLLDGTAFLLRDDVQGRQEN